MMKEVNMMIGLMMLTLKYVKSKVHCWLKETAQRIKSSKCSSRSSRSISHKGILNSKKPKDSHKSRSSRASRETSSSKLSKDREIEEKIKVPEFITE